MSRFLRILLTSMPLLAQRVDPKAIQSIFAEYDRPGSPGCAVGVLEDGKFIFEHGYGYANLDYDLSLTSQTVFDIGSTSKQFSAISMLLLERDGKLNIDDPVRKYIPELREYGKPLTIRHMLNHTSGLRDYLTLGRLAGNTADDFFTDPEVTVLIARQKNLNFQPGEEWLYSNSGYFLVSQIVPRVTGGKTLPQFLQERVFTPLGMTHTHSHDDHTQIVRQRATGYSRNEKGELHLDMSTLDMVGDGGVYTTIEDLAKWDAQFYDPNSTFAPLLKKMQQPAVLNNGKKLAYGLGLFVETWTGKQANQPLISHGGAWAGFRAELARLPEIHLSVITLCNLGNINPPSLARKVLALYVPGEPPPPPTRPLGPGTTKIELSAGQLKALAGTYQSEELGVSGTVAIQAGKLTLHVRRADWTFIPESATTFRSGLMTLNFRGNGFTVDFGRVKGVEFHR